MHQADLYEKNNTCQKQDAIKFLDEYANKIKWKQNGDRLIDIGCGGGGVTDILKTNYMPTTFSKIVGCDISENMIQFANDHYGDRRTEFQVLDIEGKVPEALRENFDHVVSFNALHWIKNQEAAFQNIYTMLAGDGDCLLLFLGRHVIYDTFRILSRNSKWSQYLNDVDHLFVSPYHDSLNPEEEIINMLEKIGFVNIEVTCKQDKFVFYDEEQWKNITVAVNPFDIPKEMLNDFFDDAIEVIKNVNEIIKKRNSNNVIDNDNNVQNSFHVIFNYNYLIVYAQKRS